MKHRSFKPLSFVVVSMLMVVLPVSANAPTLRADLTATSMKAADSSHLGGTLVAFFQENNDPNTEGASPDFSLKAEKLRLETDSVAVAIHTVVFYNHEPTTSPPEHYSNATVTGLENSPGHRWNVFAADKDNPPSIEVSAGCASGKPATANSIERIALVNLARPSTRTDTARSLQWDCMDGATVRVTGDLRLSLWEWDAILTADGTSGKELHSGRSQSSQVPAGAPDLSGAISEDREIYLVAYNATLTVPVLTGSGYTLHTGADTLLSASSLELQGAAGRLVLPDGELRLQGSALAVQGSVGATLAGTGPGRPFNAQLVGSPESVVVDGRTVLAGTVTVGIPVSYVLRGGLGLLLLGLVVVVTYLACRPYGAYARAEKVGLLFSPPPRTRRERRGVGYWVMAHHALAKGRLLRGWLYAWNALRLFPASLDAAYVLAAAYGQSEDWKRAIPLYEKIHPHLQPGRERAENAGIIAIAWAQLGRLEEAHARLLEAARNHLPTFDEFLQNPVFDALMKSPMHKSLRQTQARPDPAFT